MLNADNRLYVSPFRIKLLSPVVENLHSIDLTTKMLAIATKSSTPLRFTIRYQKLFPKDKNLIFDCAL